MLSIFYLYRLHYYNVYDESLEQEQIQHFFALLKIKLKHRVTIPAFVAAQSALFIVNRIKSNKGIVRTR